MANPSAATYDDVNLILKLYEMRREPRMRTARAWFSANFKVKTVAEYYVLCPTGSNENAYARMVFTHWDMVASFVNSGVLHQDLFFQSGRELLFVWLRVEPLLEEWRTLYDDPYYLNQLSFLGKAFAEYMSNRSAASFENFAKRVRA